MNYKIEELNLFLTWNKSDVNRLDKKKMSSVLEAMSHTSMKDSLKRIRVYSKNYPYEKLDKLAKSNGFKDIEIIGDDDEPNPDTIAEE